MIRCLLFNIRSYIMQYLTFSMGLDGKVRHDGLKMTNHPLDDLCLFL